MKLQKIFLVLWLGILFFESNILANEFNRAKIDLDELSQNPEKLGRFFKETGLNPNSYIPRPEMTPIINDKPDTILEGTLFRASQDLSLARIFVGEDAVDKIKAYQFLLSEMLKFVDDNDPGLTLKEKEFKEKCKLCIEKNRNLSDKKNRSGQEESDLAMSNLNLLEQSDCKIYRIFSERLKNKKNK